METETAAVFFSLAEIVSTTAMKHLYRFQHKQLRLQFSNPVVFCSKFSVKMYFNFLKTFSVSNIY
jgi:hypothetical protein